MRTRLEDHSEVETLADASDLLTQSNHIGDAHYRLAVLLVINRITWLKGVDS